MKIFLTILALSSLLLFSSDDSQYAQTIRDTAKAMDYQLSEDELEMWIERLKSYNSNDIEKFDDDINAFVEQDFINPPKKNEFLFNTKVSPLNCCNFLDGWIIIFTKNFCLSFRK